MIIIKILIICSKKFYSKIEEVKKILEEKNIEVFLPNCYDDPTTEQRMWDLGKEEHQKLILRESCFKGIDGARIESMAFKDTPEHKSIVEEANKRIEEGRRREAKAYNDAKYYFGR